MSEQSAAGVSHSVRYQLGHVDPSAATDVVPASGVSAPAERVPQSLNVCCGMCARLLRDPVRPLAATGIITAACRVCVAGFVAAKEVLRTAAPPVPAVDVNRPGLVPGSGGIGAAAGAFGAGALPEPAPVPSIADATRGIAATLISALGGTPAGEAVDMVMALAPADVAALPVDEALARRVAAAARGGDSSEVPHKSPSAYLPPPCHTLGCQNHAAWSCATCGSVIYLCYACHDRHTTEHPTHRQRSLEMQAGDGATTAAPSARFSPCCSSGKAAELWCYVHGDAVCIDCRMSDKCTDHQSAVHNDTNLRRSAVKSMQKREVQAQRVADTCSMLRGQIAVAESNCVRGVAKVDDMATALHAAVDTRAAALRCRIEAAGAVETGKLQTQLQLCEQVLGCLQAPLDRYYTAPIPAAATASGRLDSVPATGAVGDHSAAARLAELPLSLLAGFRDSLELTGEAFAGLAMREGVLVAAGSSFLQVDEAGLQAAEAAVSAWGKVKCPSGLRMGTPQAQADGSVVLSWTVDFLPGSGSRNVITGLEAAPMMPEPGASATEAAYHGTGAPSPANSQSAELVPLTAASAAPASTDIEATGIAVGATGTRLIGCATKTLPSDEQVCFAVSFTTLTGGEVQPVDGARLALPATLPYRDAAQLSFSKAEAAAAYAAGARYVRVALATAGSRKDASEGGLRTILQPLVPAATGNSAFAHVLAATAPLPCPDTVEVRCTAGAQYACCYVGAGIVATAGAGGTISFFDVGSGIIVKQLQGRATLIQALGMWPANRCLVASHQDGVLECWDTSKWTATQIPSPGCTCSCGSILALPDGRLAVAGFDPPHVYVYSVDASVAPLALVCGPLIWQLALLPTGLLAGSGNDGRVYVWDLKSTPGKPPMIVGEAAGRPLYALCALPDGRMLSASYATPSVLKVWSPTASGDGFDSAQIASDCTFPYAARALQLGSGLVALTASTNIGGASVVIMDPRTPKVVRTLPGGTGWGAAALPDGRLAVATTKQVLYIYGADSLCSEGSA